MAKPKGHPVENGAKSSEEAPVEMDVNNGDDVKWGTWEELLLACAVNRYGTNNWDSVAIEIQKRYSSSSSSSTTTSSSLLLTPRNCQIKYLELTRRFFTKINPPNKSDADADDGDGGVIAAADDSVPLLEELRKLRVAELRRELERYDLSIVSLQSKVKKMKEERERTTRDSENREANSTDLSKSGESETPPERDASEDEREVKGDSQKSPLSVAGEPVSGKFMNESVSGDGRDEDVATGRNEGEEKEEQPGRTGDENEEPIQTGEDKPVREEDSCYGSSDSVEKEEPVPEPVQKEVKIEMESVSDSPELMESVAESKRGGEEEATTKECSDVQSSATRSTDDSDKDRMLRGSRDDDDLENKNRSAAVKLEASVESQPFADFLENLKGSKLGSVFLRRLDSQEAPNYNNLIRQHVDLETVQTRLKEGAYLSSNLRFFRDLLLIVNNALVFFSKNTAEFIAAIELRHVIANEMVQKNASSDSSPEKKISLEKVTVPKKENSEPSEPLLLKPKLGGPLIVCRKRSSIAAKASASSSASDKKREQTAKPPEERAGPTAKQQPPQLPAKAEEPRITKKRSSDRFASVSTSLKKNGKNGTNTNSKQATAAILEKNKGKGSSSSQQPEPRSESKNNQSSLDLKKRGAANFLNRMKQSSFSNSGTLLDALKSSPPSAANNSKGGSDHKKNETGKGNGGSEHKKNAKGSAATEHKKNENGKGSGKREQVSTRSSNAKQAKEKGSPAKEKGSPAKKKPPKRGAAPTPPSGKRSRDGRESESAASKPQRKRSRK